MSVRNQYASLVQVANRVDLLEQRAFVTIHCDFRHDARLFMMPPPPPHDPVQWPTIDVVLESLRGITPDRVRVMGSDSIDLDAIQHHTERWQINRVRESSSRPPSTVYWHGRVSVALTPGGSG